MHLYYIKIVPKNLTKFIISEVCYTYDITNGIEIDFPIQIHDQLN